MTARGTYRWWMSVCCAAWLIRVDAQVYTHPTVGVQSTYNGACLVSTCSGTYYDNGGAAGNYALNVNNIYRTFCPSTPGQCVRATFTSFSMNDVFFLCFGPNSCCDYLQILNGPAQNSPVLYSNCTTSPGTITANNPSGCLTFRFVSDGSVALPGWAATLSCVPCAAGPSGTSNADCQYATPVCSDQALTDVSTGPGIVAQGCSGCNTSEVFTNWYRIQVQTSGTLGLTINPNVNSDDFDPVLYGPNVTCAGLGTPIRCSYAASAGNGNTGLGNGAMDASEGVAGDQWVSVLNVTAGQTYYLLVNGWSAASGTNGFLMDWTGTAGLNCTILPVEMISFRATCEGGWPFLQWSTASEHNSSHFVVERSYDGDAWEEIGVVNAMGESQTEVMYQFMDTGAGPSSLVFYRLQQVDKDGAVAPSGTIALKGCDGPQASILAVPNPTNTGTRLVVELGTKQSGSANVAIRDAMGRLLHTFDHRFEAGRFEVGLPLVDQPAGTYLIIVSTTVTTEVLRTRVVKH